MTPLLEREDERITVRSVSTAEDAMTVIDERTIDCVVSGYDLSDATGLSLLQTIRQEHTELPFILFADKPIEDIARDAITLGVTEYLQKRGTDQYTVLANKIVGAVEQYRTLEEAKHTEQLLHEIAEKSNDVLWVFSSDWDELLFVNSAVEDLFGLSIERLQTHPHSFVDSIHPADRKRVQNEMGELSQGESKSTEYRVNEREDYSRWVWTQAEPIIDETGSVERIVGFSRDITDHKNHERSLAALNTVAVDLDTDETSDEIYQRAIDASQEILEFDLSVIDTEEDGSLHKEVISEQISTAEATTMSVEEGIAGKTYRSGESLLIDNIENYPEANPQGPFQSGVSVPIDTYGVFQAVAEDPHAFDTTDLELAELLMSHVASALDRLEREHRLQQQNERLEEFTRTVSHDLRNPLNVLEGYLESAQMDCESAHLEDATEILTRMNAIVDDTLTLASSGRDIDGVELVHLETVARGCWQNVTTESATLEVSADSNIRADTRRLHHAFENLFRNAIDHGGSDVTVRVGELDDGFYIEDDGTGIPETDRERIFDLGYTKNSGTGFGLAIVRQVTKAHNWKITVADSDDGGARFEISNVTIE